MNGYQPATNQAQEVSQGEERYQLYQSQALLHDFAVAIGILIAVSATLHLLMHWFVPGM